MPVLVFIDMGCVLTVLLYEKTLISVANNAGTQEHGASHCNVSLKLGCLKEQFDFLGMFI